ncbi:DUF6975 family protein [Sphingomonas nostoxanthinifaciens]|uniref:DUF6975 family protein n=1 Tax=Sphingomonas nostoxanthinifaciens TaxID=2872652 RepID=UPI001CC1C258|nr:hypothetical protein [Sphingomonas nostoxanthinifaciens]UAK23894.1 hypothetical protein K8P63_16230 [Sphingomonas nostoxanthinifaciens]
MPFAALEQGDADFGAMMVALAATEGSASHPYTVSIELNADSLATRNLADTLHLLSMLHGVHPGLIEMAADRNVLPEADEWFHQAVSAFTLERAYLAQLIVAAGPVPSTPGETETAATVANQRHAFGTIAASDRFGCSLGAAAAMVLDWQSIRSVLDTGAARLGVTVGRCRMPDEELTATLLARLPEQPRLGRTLAFGARQLLVQHCGLWDLLEARAAARVAQDTRITG